MAYVMFVLIVFTEMYRKGQNKLNCIFVEIEKAYDGVPREKLHEEVKC